MRCSTVNRADGRLSNLQYELRQRVRDSLAEMHDYLRRGCTPKVKPQKGCSACSLKELCLPKLMKAKSVSGYLKGAMEE